MGVGSKRGAEGGEGGGGGGKEEGEEEEGSLCKRTVTTFRHAPSHHFGRDQAPRVARVTLNMNLFTGHVVSCNNNKS